MKYLFRPVIWMFLLLAFVSAPIAFAADHPAPGPLSFAERLACVEKVEDVYWAHRIWPEDNPGSKPAREMVMPRTEVAAKVEHSLTYEAILEQAWGIRLTTAQIQAELDRIANNTLHPELIRDLFTALDRDPYLVAECYVRPRMLERLVKQRFSSDPEIHGGIRRQAERTLSVINSATDLGDPHVAVLTNTWIVGSSSTTSSTDPPRLDSSELSPAEWTELINVLASRFQQNPQSDGGQAMTTESRNTLESWTGQGLSRLFETSGSFQAVEIVELGEGTITTRTMTWPKRSLSDWLSEIRSDLRSFEPTVGEFRLPNLKNTRSCTDGEWTSAPNLPDVLPPAPTQGAAVWTGTEMIVWGGTPGASFDTGGRYDPATDTWALTSTTNAPSGRQRHTAVWTGTEMIVWGGDISAYPPAKTGGRYNPATDTWVATALTDAPSGREEHKAVWTGSEMIIWGGGPPTTTGGRYDPVTDTWTATTTVDAPLSRVRFTAVWTGTEMIIWGGYDGATDDSGGRYDPTTNSWTATSMVDVPHGRESHTAVWSGTEMIIWGGNAGGYNDTGGRYNPTTDTWTDTTMVGVPTGMRNHAAIWTGSEMVVWGTTEPTPQANGGRYNPVTDSWTIVTTLGAPPPRSYHTGVWTGSEMIVWGGRTASGGRYNPAFDSWILTAGSSAPAGRRGHTGVWTGTEMILWGGIDTSGYTSSGGRYDPAADDWLSTEVSGAPSSRYNATAVWTGTEMIVWGGLTAATNHATGGRYNPATDSWSPTTTTDGPSARQSHTAVWTGTEMIIWGGYSGSPTDTGGRYDPSTDGWTSTSTTGAPTARWIHTGIWTGGRMIVWGGYNSVLENTGGQYDPATDGWSATTTTGAPTARNGHSAVWTGTEMIVWGGTDGWEQNTGGRYDPALDSWVATTTSEAPFRRASHTAVWSGAEMIVWGGYAGSNLNTGGRYDPASNSWTATTLTGAPAPRRSHSSIWTGREMIIWGGSNGEKNGGRYCAVTLQGVDYGDAPDPDFPTLLASDGARHFLYGSVFLGLSADADVDGQPTSIADGDDTDLEGDDEDGVTFTTPAIPAGSAEVEIVASDPSFLSAWVDFSSDGDWDDPGEQIFADETLVAGTNTLGFAVPDWAEQGTYVHARFRVDSSGGLSYSGEAPDGEVEDHRVFINELDLGDAPDPTYPTLLASDGPRHVANGPLYLGAQRDPDDDGQPNLDATGDDSDGTDDEDGITVTSPMVAGVTADIEVVASAVGLLNAWIDYNADGDWDDPDEQVFTDEPLAGGTNALQVMVPVDAVPGPTFARFRADSVGGLSFTGEAPDGEVEDYLVIVEELDFGDAPDPTFPTLLASNGARHVIDGATYLGATVDAEPDGQPDANANGDDNDAQGDDEDGITFMNTPFAGQLCTIRVTASTAGVVNAWIDYNADGDWADAGEHVFVDVAVVAGQNNLDYAIPITAVTGVDTFARFRFSTAGGLSYDGLAPDGEVEDYKMGIMALDYGDAPDPTYPTLDASDGARHIIGGGLYLGASVDFEADGQPTAGADGDDLDGNDDEDGVVFTSGIGAGLDASLEVAVSGTGMLNAWVDFNSDGDWADAGEQVVTDQALVAGVNPLSFTVPAGANLGITFARFRLSTSGGLSFNGHASDGEVEDYAVEIVEGPDLSIEMTASTEPAPSGRPLTYTITVTNNGPLPATSVAVTDALPGQLIFVSSTPGSPECTYSVDTLACDLGTMAPTDTAVITVDTVLDYPVYGSFSNTATVTAAELDPIQANNSAAVDTIIALFVDGFETGDTTGWD